MKNRNRVSLFNILSTCLLYGISLFTAPLFSRLLGTDGYGAVANYTVWVSVLSVSATLLTYGTLAPAMVEYPEEDQKKYQSSVMTLSLCTFFTVTVLIALFLGPISRGLRLSPFFIFLILFQSIGTFGINFMNTKLTYEMQAGKNLILSVGTSLTTLVLSLVLVLLLPQGLKHYGRILGIALVYGVLGLLMCLSVLRGGRTFYAPGYWKFCVPLAIPLVFYNLADLLLGHSDVIMLRQLLSQSTSGIYNYGYQLGTILFTLFNALNNSWVAFFYADFKQGKTQDVRRQSRNFLELFTVLSAGFLLLCREVYMLYARQDFWAATNLVPLFAASHYLTFLGTFPANYEYYHKKMKMGAAATIVSCLVNIGLNLVLIQKMGIAGAAVATVLAHGLQFAMHYVYTRFFLGGKDYIFSVRLWGPYALGFLAVLALTYGLADLPLLRWGMGAALGLWELLRIKKRKALI